MQSVFTKMKKKQRSDSTMEANNVKCTTSAVTLNTDTVLVIKKLHNSHCSIYKYVIVNIRTL